MISGRDGKPTAPDTSSGQHLRAAEGRGADTPSRERGFSLLVALMVMALLTTLGLTLMFTSETERAISRNFSGTIQANYAAEAMVDAAVQAFVFDLKNDTVGGWANRYLVVCDVSDEAICLSRYGFDPTAAACYNAGTPANGCVQLDSSGNLTGSTGNWVADLMWRPSGTKPDFPSRTPVRIHPDLKAVMPWWKKFTPPIDWKNPSDPDALNVGSAGFAVTSLCLKNCTSPNPSPLAADYSQRTAFITGIGQSATKLQARITRTKNPATRAVSVRVDGDLLPIWGNALVGGQGGSQTQVIEGDYLIRGSVLMFNSDPSKTVLAFNNTSTGIVNNYYDSDSVPPIHGWWWQSARPCGTPECDGNNTANIGGPDSDSDASVFTAEPIHHHLADPPDQNKLDSLPGGYRPDSPYASDYPGPEGLDAVLRLRKGVIEIASASAGIGRVETLEGAASNPGRYWDNVKKVLLNDSAIQSPTEITGGGKDEVYRNVASTWDLHTKTGAFDIDSETFKFPNLTDVYVEPFTKERYDSYYDFLRPATPTAAHPGGWALDLSDIDGTTGVGRDIVAADLNGDTCWPRGGLTPSPSLTQLHDALDNSFLMPGGCFPYTVNDASTTCGTDFGTCASPPASCTVTMVYGGAFPTCPAGFSFPIYVRTTKSFTADPTLNLDTSSSIDSPKGRAQSTMFDSFAYKLYVDVLGDMDACGPPGSKIYENNLASLPAVFTNEIPTVYYGKDSTSRTTCFAIDGPCFSERSAYMDVHIQLADAPYWAGTSPRRNWGGRWFSVRYRPPGDPNGVMTILSDPRAANGCSGQPASDFAFETLQVGTRNFLPDASNFTGSTLVTQASGYDRAWPVSAADTEYKDMPTGAFVVSLHLPCTDDLSPSNNNPYKCSQSDTVGYTAPAGAYPGFYTHTIAWAPKYSCWRTAGHTFDSDPDGNAPPTIPPAAGCTTGTCGDYSVSWFGQSLWQTNWTTLWNNPPVIGKGTPDTSTPPFYGVGATFVGYKLMVPQDNEHDDNAPPPPCNVGLDRRTAQLSDQCAGLRAIQCGVDNDGDRCNGSVSAASGTCATTHACTVLDPCQDEVDFVKNGRAYGGCTEILSPLSSMRVAELDPSTTASTPFDRNSALNRVDCNPLATGCTGASCAYTGVDPDKIAGWTDNRYYRLWPGWSSAAYLEGAGLVFTRNEIRFGAPKKDCENPNSCPTLRTAVADYNTTAPLSATGASRGFFSDPIVFDGRLILYAGDDTTSGSTKVYFHDHLVPRTRFGCSDFISVLANGDAEVDMQMPYDAAAGDRHHLLAAYSLTQGILKVVTPDSDSVQTELAGSWIADGADFGDRSTSGLPVQIIGTPTVSDDRCDHPYLPGRDPFPQRTYVSFVEDETLSSGL